MTFKKVLCRFLVRPVAIVHATGGHVRLPDITPLRREPFYEWHANLLAFDRRKGIIMMNNQIRYCVVLYGLKAEHFKKLGHITLSAVVQTFLAEGFSEDAVKRYINHCGEVVFTKTHDRIVIPQMNDMLYLTSHGIASFLPISEIRMLDLNKKLGEVPVGSLKYAYPIDGLRRALNSE